MLSCDYCKVFKNTYFKEQLFMAASEFSKCFLKTYLAQFFYILLCAIKDRSVICTPEHFWRCRFWKPYFGCNFSVNKGLYNYSDQYSSCCVHFARLHWKWEHLSQVKEDHINRTHATKYWLGMPQFWSLNLHSYLNLPYHINV